MSCTILLHAERPPDEGLRRYHNPDPSTSSEEGVSGALDKDRIVREVFMYGSLCCIRQYRGDWEATYHQNSRSTDLAPSSITTFLSVCFSASPSHPAGTDPPPSINLTAAKYSNLTEESPIKRTWRLGEIVEAWGVLIVGEVRHAKRAFDGRAC
jgi:hypothetical protein